MKRVLIAVVLLSIISFLSISCEELGIESPDLLTIDGPDLLLDFTIEPVDVPGLHIFKEETFDENVDSLLGLYDISRERLESVKLVKAEVEITGPSDTMSLDYLDLLKITIYTSELGEKTIAENFKIPHGVKKIELDLMESDVKEYLESEEYILTVYGKLNTRTYETRELEARIKYKYSLFPG